MLRIHRSNATHIPNLIERPRLPLASLVDKLYHPLAREGGADPSPLVVPRNRTAPAHHSDIPPQFLHAGVIKGREGRCGCRSWVWGSKHVVHGRSRMAIDPRVPTMPGRSTVGFPPTRQTLRACTKRQAKREVLGGSSEK